MSVEEIIALIADQQWDELERVWARTARAGASPADLAETLRAVADAGRADLAEMLGWTFLAEQAEQAPPADALEAVHAILPALSGSADIRAEAEQAYRRAYADHEHVEALLAKSGLAGEQSPRRALRALDTCLAAVSGRYVTGRFEDRVLRVERFDPQAGRFELTDGAGRTHQLEPLPLADDFVLTEETDFRVLRHFRADELGGMLDDDPAAVLVGLCQAHGGHTDADRIRKELVDRYLPADGWSRWWTRARSAAKRCPQLVVGGKSPVTVSYHREGLTLEREMAPALAAARGPTELLAVLEQYVRQARQRKCPVDQAFAATIVESLAGQARAPLGGRVEIALVASASIAAAVAMGVAPPEADYPRPEQILAAADRPAEVVAALTRPDLWPAALDALAARDDGREQLEALLRLAPAAMIDEVVRRLLAAGDGQRVADAAAEALADPVAGLERVLWMWSGPAEPPPNVPGNVELLSKVLDALQRIDHDAQLESDWRRDARQRIRGALSARDYQGYRRAIAEMDEAVAATFRTRINRLSGLAQAVREDMARILREAFGSLFHKAAVAAWLDESTIWTTPDARRKREETLRDIVEVKMPINEKAVGEALAHGDLRENSEYKFACEERNFLQARAAKLTDELSRGRIIVPEDVPQETAGIGSRLRLRRLSDGRELTVTILGPWDTDLANRVYSYQTTLALEFLGKTIGQTGTIKIEGIEGEYQIEGLECGVEEG
ncbi:MAG TPA: GreA/GreB family elongation factor [Phycisphaerae bacterium]|nr:GreA/GreB family elongation factor [Phycisphaerae bacterium]